MSNTIQTHWQYRALMYASIKDSDHFTKSCVVYPRMQIKSFFAVTGNEFTMTYYYIPATDKEYNSSDFLHEKEGVMPCEWINKLINKTK